MNFVCFSLICKIQYFITTKGLKFYDKNETENVVRAIEQTIGLDPRSQHSKNKHKRNFFFFAVTTNRVIRKK